MLFFYNNKKIAVPAISTDEWEDFRLMDGGVQQFVKFH